MGPEVDLRMRDVNAASGLLSLLDNYGIPFHTGDITKADDGSGKIITASNAQQTDLETAYNWGFYRYCEDANEEARSLFPSTKPFDYLYSPNYFLGPSLKLPDDWKDPPGDDIQSLTRKMLQINLLSQMNPWVSEGHEYCSREEVEAIEYPGPNVALCEMDECPSEPSFGIEWLILKIIEYPGIRSCGSEMDVTRHIGSILAGFFNIVDCTTLSNTDIMFPTALSCFGSFPRPDFACRLNVSAVRHNKMLPSSFRPIVLAGQGQEYSMSDKEVNLPHYRSHRHRSAAQLACIVQPTLILLIVDAMCKWKAAREVNPEEPFMFPEYACIHGIAYNPQGCLIYGFFPRALRFSADGTPCEWGFGCSVVSLRLTFVFKKETSYARMELVQHLLFVHRHATHLSHVLRNLTLSDEFVKCDQLLRDINGSLDEDGGEGLLADGLKFKA